MNIDAELKRVESLIDQAERIKANIKEAAETTANILAACERLGVNIVGVGAKSADIPESMSHPFGASGSVFASGKGKDGWPVAWSIVRLAGISGGCGNPGQHQTEDGTKMLDGVYRCVDGVWSKDD